MTYLCKLWCWLRGGHTQPVLFAVSSLTGTATYLCRDCLKVWREKETTGRHE